MDILQLNLGQAQAETPTGREVHFQVALLAALVGTAIGFIARFGFDAPLLPELMAQALFAILPINFIALVVGFFGPFAKHLAFLACVVLYAAALTTAAFFFLQHFSPAPSPQLTTTQDPSIPVPPIRPPPSALRKALWLSGFCLALWGLTLLGFLPALGGGWFGNRLRQGALFTAMALLISYALLTAVLAVLAKWLTKKPEVAAANNYRFSRRQVMRGISFAVLAVGVYDIAISLWDTWFQANAGRVKNGNGIFPNLDGLALEITPTEDFYQVSKNPFDPDVDVKHWQLTVKGRVENPLSLTYEALKALPAVEQYATLECIDNTIGGNLIGNALWRGVRLQDLLTSAGLQVDVVDIVLYASDGYTDSIRIERALNAATLLVYEMNGAPLTKIHGFPLRLLVPGIYGMKNVKWITGIEAVDFDFKGYWQKRGWDDQAEYQIMSRIDTPAAAVKGNAIISGIAFAGDRQISRVEVSTDNGKSWQSAEIKPALSNYTWVLWHKAWTLESAGQYTIKVRATDGRGNLQTSQNTAPDPKGATGLHRIKVTSE